MLLDVLKEFDSLTAQLAVDFNVAEEPTRAMIARMAVRHVCDRSAIRGEPPDIEKIVDAVLLARG